MGDTLYYCGFNGFRQVPNQSGQTLSTLVPHGLDGSCGGGSNDVRVRDAAICWNYLVVLDDRGAVTKYGMVNGKNGADRLEVPAATGAAATQQVTQLSAMPRHVMVCTESGECWSHEESKGWLKVAVGCEKGPAVTVSGEQHQGTAAATTPNAAEKEVLLIDLKGTGENGQTKQCPNADEEAAPAEAASISDAKSGDGSDVGSPTIVKTSCGDAHNLGLDSDGVAYNLPSPLDFDTFPADPRHRVTDVVCGKEHCLLLTEHGQVYSWGGGSRGQLGHGSLGAEERPRLVQALDGMRIKKVEAGGWHSAAISQFDDLYMFGWNESGQLAQQTNLVRPAECFAAVEKLLMACCTMQPEDTANPRGDTEDCEVYHKNDDDSRAAPGPDGRLSRNESDLDKKDSISSTCYNAATACNDEDATDLVVVQSLPMLVQIPKPSSSNSDSSTEAKVVDVGCGSRHTVVLTADGELWGFGWNKYGQLGLGHTLSKDSVQKIPLPKGVGTDKKKAVKMLRCGDWGTVLVVGPAAASAGGGNKA